jgi:hypothetical protein
VNRKPDGLEKGIRFGCGGLLGLLLGLRASLYFWVGEEVSLAVLIVVLAVVLCGFASMKMGERFWRW